MISDVNNFQLTDNFNLKEFESPDTKEVKISSVLVGVCQLIREQLNKVVEVTSGYRTVEHNASESVRGASNSYHLRGEAVDIKPPSNLLKRAFIIASTIPVVGGVGIYESGIIHIDLRREKCYWVKPLRKEYRYFATVKTALEFFKNLPRRK